VFESAIAKPKPISQNTFVQIFRFFWVKVVFDFLSDLLHCGTKVEILLEAVSDRLNRHHLHSKRI
jgi:hypothetical protein